MDGVSSTPILRIHSQNSLGATFHPSNALRAIFAPKKVKHIFFAKKLKQQWIKRLSFFLFVLTLLPTNEGFCDWNTGSKLLLINLNSDLSLNTILEKELEISVISRKWVAWENINTQFPGDIAVLNQITVFFLFNYLVCGDFLMNNSQRFLSLFFFRIILR